MKFLAFDLDGTLCNTLPDITGSLNRALAAEGFAPHTEEAVSRMVGRSIVWMVECALPDADEATRARVRDAYFADYARHYAEYTYIYPGLLPVLEQLHAAGHKMAVVTNKPHAHAVRLVETLFPRHGTIFSQVLGQSPRFPPKPAPEMLRAVLRMQGIAIEDAVYIGDSEVDLSFAKNAELPCLACGWGFLGAEGLKELGAEHILYAPADLIQFLS
ncbi:MAG: HAD family hydrolase [Clostridiales bacterium]|nr:HAD family hydrolase [Clostridiales bacterium]